MKKPVRDAIAVMSVIVVFVIAVMLMRDTTAGDPPDAAIQSEPIALSTADTEHLAASLQIAVSPEGTDGQLPGVVLLSPYLESAEVYADLAEDLARAGIAVLLVDIRHSGSSADTSGGTDQFDPASIGRMHEDAIAGLKRLAEDPRVDGERLAVLGTAISARAALLGAAAHPGTRGAVLVGAVLDSAAISVIHERADLPIMVAVSLTDGPAAEQARTLFEASPNPASAITSYINAGMASHMWRTQAALDLRRDAVGWLQERLK